MIEYIVRDPYGLVTLCEDGHIYNIDSSLIGLLNQWSMQSLRSVQTTLLTTQKLLNCRHKLPLYINSTMLFIQMRTIRSKTPFLINYFAIGKLLHHQGNDASIILKSGIAINFKSFNTINRQMELANVILSSLEKNN